MRCQSFGVEMRCMVAPSSSLTRRLSSASENRRRRRAPVIRPPRHRRDAPAGPCRVLQPRARDGRGLTFVWPSPRFVHYKLVDSLESPMLKSCIETFTNPQFSTGFEASGREGIVRRARRCAARRSQHGCSGLDGPGGTAPDRQGDQGRAHDPGLLHLPRPLGRVGEARPVDRVPARAARPLHLAHGFQRSV